MIKIFFVLIAVSLIFSEDCASFSTCDDCIKTDGCGWYSDAKFVFKCVKGSEFNCDEPECSEPHLYWKDYCPIENLPEPIHKRRSVRKYLDVQVSKEAINLIIENGAWAPSCMGVEPLRYYVIQERNLLKNISDYLKMGVDIFHGAPTALFIFAKASDDCRPFRDVDGGLAIMNIELMAYNLGLGTCTIGFTRFAEERIREIVKPSVGEDYIIAVALGHPAERKTHERNPPYIKYV